MKKVEQVKRNGQIVIDYDQKLSTSEIERLLFGLFNPIIKKENKQYILYDKIALLACNVTYLGNPHPVHKKRIQLKTYYLDYLESNKKRNLKTIYVGIYTYNKTRLFVVFEPGTYANKKSHNSSAHVYSLNLQYAQRQGIFEKTDAFGNRIHIYNTYEFVRYIKMLANDPVYIEEDELNKLINNCVKSFGATLKSEWNGVDCYRELIADNDNNAKQGEWPGWYFEYIFKKFIKENNISEVEPYASKKKGDIDLDVKFINEEWVFGDLKADQINSDILGNSLECLDKVIKQNHGTVYYICCLYKAEKDSLHDYEVTKFWNSCLRDVGKRYSTLEELKNGYGRKMKYSVKPKMLCVLKIDECIYDVLKDKPFNQGLNSDGNERKPKLKITKSMMQEIMIYSQFVE